MPINRLHIQAAKTHTLTLAPTYCGQSVAIRDTVSRHHPDRWPAEDRLCPECLEAYAVATSRGANDE